MIPYTGLGTWHIGFVPIQVWGLMVALGFVAGILVVRAYARKYKISADDAVSLALWLTVAGFVGARLGHVFLYDWPYYRLHLTEIVYVWQGGLSSIGGFIGAAAVLAVYWYKRRRNFWKIADALAFAFPLAWGIGRIGCFLIHDHPGVCTDFVLGMREPEGCARHDLGLYDSLLGFIIFGVFLLLMRRKEKLATGRYTALLLILYSLPRYFLDFLRIWEGPAADARFSGLTPAQYGSIILLVIGIVMWRRKRNEVEKTHA